MDLHWDYVTPVPKPVREDKPRKGLKRGGPLHRRTALKARSPLKRRTRLKAVRGLRPSGPKTRRRRYTAKVVPHHWSAIRPSRDRIPAKTWLFVMQRDAGRCQLPGHDHPAQDEHHVFRRGMGGSSDPDRHNPARLLALAHRCHIDIVEQSRSVREFLKECCRRGLLGEEHRTERDALWATWRWPPGEGSERCPTSR